MTRMHMQTRPHTYAHVHMQVCSLAASAGRLFVADSGGHICALSTAAMLEGRSQSISWRAHDGKAACLHAWPHAGAFLSGGSDGAVRNK